MRLRRPYVTTPDDGTITRESEGTNIVRKDRAARTTHFTIGLHVREPDDTRWP